MAGGTVKGAPSREYGRAMLTVTDPGDPLMQSLPSPTQVWMSHGDTITDTADHFHIIGSTDNVRVAAYHVEEKRHGAYSSIRKCITRPTARSFSATS